MTNLTCPKCNPEGILSGSRIKRAGRYRRKSDCRVIQMFRCLNCNRSFIRPNACHGQLKRQINHDIFKLLASGVSQRRIAIIQNINRKTVARKLDFLGVQAREKLRLENLKRPKAKIVVFDDLETFEHSKMKPLSVTLAVTDKRWGLDFEVSQMSANGLLAEKSVKKYGKRKDMRSFGRNKMFLRMTEFVDPEATFRSDQNQYYPSVLKKHFPKSTHVTFKGKRGSNTGQGELKKVQYDPLFALNHTCAMFRDSIKRLVRKTWCTTKSRERLSHHIAIYLVFHNFVLLKESA